MAIQLTTIKMAGLEARPFVKDCSKLAAGSDVVQLPLTR